LADAIGNAEMENGDDLDPGILSHWIPDGSKELERQNLLSAADQAMTVVAPLLDRITAAEARAEEAEKLITAATVQADGMDAAAKWMDPDGGLRSAVFSLGAAARNAASTERGTQFVLSHLVRALRYVEAAEAATADRDRLADEVARLSARADVVLKLLEPSERRPCCCTRCDCGNVGDAAAVVAWDAQNALYEAATTLNPPAREGEGDQP
jgi:hypothetical protein